MRETNQLSSEHRGRRDEFWWEGIKEDFLEEEEGYLTWAQRMAGFGLLGLRGKGAPCSGNHMAKALSCPRNAVIVLVWNVGFACEQRSKG